jgi:hypothetical protein
LEGGRTFKRPGLVEGSWVMEHALEVGCGTLTSETMSQHQFFLP